MRRAIKNSFSTPQTTHGMDSSDSQTVETECTVLIPGTRGENVIVDAVDADKIIHAAPQTRVIQDHLSQLKTGETFTGEFIVDNVDGTRKLMSINNT